jgi:hypothetical protein
LGGDVHFVRPEKMNLSGSDAAEIVKAFIWIVIFRFMVIRSACWDAVSGLLWQIKKEYLTGTIKMDAAPAVKTMMMKLPKIIISIFKGIIVFIIFIMMIAAWSFLDEKD